LAADAARFQEGQGAHPERFVEGIACESDIEQVCLRRSLKSTPK